MPDGPPPPILIDKSASLDSLVRELSANGEIAVDTEADSYYSYREKVCLIQISTAEHDFLVDPLADLNILTLAPIFANGAIRKVFHDAEYDIQLLKSAGFLDIKNIFDTRLAVALLGSKTPGLANVVRERFGVVLDKSQQKSDWRRRPLTREQLEYARHDTRYLLRLAKEVEGDLASRDRAELFHYECERMIAAPARTRVFDIFDCLTIRGAEDLDPMGLSALRELTAERERVAAEADVATFRIISNELLVLLARLRPRDWNELNAVRAMPPKLKENFGACALSALERARAAGPWVPRRPRPEYNDEEIYILEKLKKWRTRKAEQYQMDSAYVLNRHTMGLLAKHVPRSMEQLERIPGLAPWQLRNFGGEIIQLLNA